MARRRDQPSLPGFDPPDRSSDKRAAPRGSTPGESPGGTPPAAGPTSLTGGRELGGAGEWSVVRQSPAGAPENLAGQSVWVVDAHSLIHQVFHAVPEMTTRDGRPVNAVFGFTRDLFYLLTEKKPDYLFCAVDVPGKTFRNDLYPDYKAHRPPLDEDLAAQLAPIEEVVRALGIPVLGCEGFEADDVMATVANWTEQRGGQCFLVTSDKDCRQLISDRVWLYNIRKNQLLDRDALEKEWGIAPEQVVDFQALVGDSSDNVPGVPLIGPKNARELLAEYRTLDNLLDHAAEVSGAKRRENLLAFRDQAMLSRRLVELRRDVPVAVDWESARRRRIDRDRLRALFEQFSFRSLLEKIDQIDAPRAEPASVPSAAIEVTVVDSLDALAALAAELARQRSISIDTETTGLQPRSAELVGLSFSADGRRAWYVPVRAPEGEPRLEATAVLDALRGVLENPAIEKIGQNLKYDWVVLRSAGVSLSGVAFDTMVASYLLEAGERNHNLGELARRYLGHTTIKISELIGSGSRQKRMDEVPVARVAEYSGEDAVLPVRLQPILAGKLREAGVERLFAELEMPLVGVLAEMEYTGIKVDVDALTALGRRYGERMAAIEEEIHRLAGRPFNIASNKQLQELLFAELKLPAPKQTAKTGPSTDAEVLEQLARRHPLPARLLEYRQYAKLKSTYVDALPRMVCPATGRIHASFHQTVAATGRLSSSDPNLQNIPVRTPEGREIRAAFIPGEDGWVLLSADYSQIELRILAHYSGDERLCEAFARDEDIHARVASQVTGVPLEQVTPEMRRAAKAVNFGVIYGQSAFGLSKALGISKAEAARFIDDYFARYPRIEAFLRQVLDQCRKTGYATTILGRRRAIRGIRPGAARQRNLPERTAVNTVIQGSAADLIKRAMIAVAARLRREKSRARMLLQIHDELVFEVPEGEAARLASWVAEEMAGVARLAVPLKVDVKAGPNWAAAEPIG